MPSVFLLLQKTLKLYKHYFAIVAGYVAWLLLPYLASVLVRLFPNQTPVLQTLDVLFILILAVLAVWVFLILARFFAAVDRGHKKIELSSLQSYCAKRLPALMWVIILQTITVAGGFILLIIPGLIFYVWFAFSQLAAIIDEKNGTAALSFSRKLVKGRFFATAWLLLGGTIILVATYSIFASLAIGVIGSIAGIDFAALAEAGQQIPIWAEAIQMIGELFFLAPISLIYVIVLYDWLVASRLYPEADTKKDSTETE